VRLVVELRSELPRQLSRIIAHCLEKDTSRRLQAAADLRNELEALRKELTLGPPSPRSSIAVLPFTDMSREKDQDYFCEGVAEEILNTLGKIKDPKVLETLPVLFEALDDPDPEVRDTAARAIGKMCEHLNPDLVSEEIRREMFERLLAKVSDRFAHVRSKAIRSLGKMARFGLLGDDRKARLGTILKRVLGEDEAGNWDLAYIVRAEAEKAKEHL